MDFNSYQPVLQFHRRGTISQDVSLLIDRKNTLLNNYAVGTTNQN